MGLDGEERQYSAFISTIPTVFPRSAHILCSWHLFDRGQKESGINLSLVDKKNQVQGNAYMKVVTRWLFSWTDSVESRSEFELSYKLLLQWLGSSDLTSVFPPLLVERISSFVAKSVVPHLDKILLSNRMRRRCFDMRTTSNSEAENSVVKRHPVGPRPNESIDKSTKALTLIADSRLLKKEQNAASALDTIPTVGYKRGIHDQITNHAANLVMAQYNEQPKYVLYRLDEQTFYVKRKHHTPKTGTDWRRDNFGLYMVPSFERTRIVRILNHGNGEYLVCSCCYFERHGVGCRHTYKVLKHHPKAYDVAVRWHKGLSIWIPQRGL
jgi:hypothetical protein